MRTQLRDPNLRPSDKQTDGNERTSSPNLATYPIELYCCVDTDWKRKKLSSKQADDTRVTRSLSLWWLCYAHVTIRLTQSLAWENWQVRLIVWFAYPYGVDTYSIGGWVCNGVQISLAERRYDETVHHWAGRQVLASFPNGIITMLVAQRANWGDGIG